jgi:hypothetical protein
MKIRWRLALVLAVSLLLVGSAAIFITSIGYERAVFNSPFDLQAEILKELGVKRSIAVEYLRKHPEAALSYDTGKPITADGRSVNDIFTDIQRRHQRASVRRSRVVSAAALGVLASVAPTGAPDHEPRPIGFGARPRWPRRALGTRRRDEAAGRHVRRDARPHRAVVRRAAPLLFPGVARAAHPAVGDQE